jgi:hypothetical protein
MGDTSEQTWLKESDEFFAPASTDLVDGMVGQYRKDRQRIIEIAQLIGSDPCVSHFLEGNRDVNSRYSAPSVSRLFEVNGAFKHLDADYWSRTLALTDVLDHMNNDRRQEWHDQIRENKCPEFEESTVRSTLRDLLLSREKFFAERVDGIFRNLSREHVTNSPMGFRKRMIISGIHGLYSHSYKMCGYLSDLRVVIAKFMGREAPNHLSSDRIVKIALYQHGQWLKIDGGSMRIRVYLKGTAHLEVHPDMAWRLNCVLAQLYPSAIPSEFRKKPEKRVKEFDLIQRPLPFSVLEILDDIKEVYEPLGDDHRPTHRKIPNAYSLDHYNRQKPSAREAEKTLQSIGGVPVKHYWVFDYNPRSVIDEIVASGCVPDHVSHQYYPTPENVARDAIEMAEIGEHDICLEPSAGQGGLADFMPKDRTTCIEISEMHCKILEEKGYRPICGDFLKMNTFLDSYTRIVMNPPYSEGRWQAHLQHAFKFLASDGVLVAILPASAKGKELIKGAKHEFSRVYENEFQGTSVRVIIVKVRK